MSKSSRKQKSDEKKATQHGEVELLLNVTMDYKASKSMESIEWDWSKGDCDRDHMAI